MKTIFLTCGLVFTAIFAVASVIPSDTGITPLIDACRSGDFPLVKKLVEEGADVNGTSGYYHRTALMYAVNGSIHGAEIVDYLLKNGAKLEITDRDNNTALLCCLSNNPRKYGTDEKQLIPVRRKVAWILLRAGAKVKVCNDRGLTPLLAAGSWMGAAFIAEILKSGVNIEARTQYNGNTPLVNALDSDNTEVVELLLKHGADPNARNYGDTAAIFSAKSIKAVKMLLSKGVKLDCRKIMSRRGYTVLKSMSVLESWALWADLELIKLALEKQCPVNGDVLVAAVGNRKNPEVFPLLFEHYKGKDKLPLGKMLNHAAQTANVSGVKLLLTKGADMNYINEFGRPTLVNACLNTYGGAERYKVVELLLSKGADPNISDKQGKTPLMWLMRQVGPIETAKLLISYGAEIEKKDNQGRTALLALMAAPYYRNKEALPLLEFLFENNADLNIKDKNEASALLLALGHHQPPEVIKYLLKRDVDVNTASKNNVTPLMLAARHYEAEIVKLLLERGADINATDDTGWTPLIYAAEYWPIPRGDVIFPVPHRRDRKDPQETIKLLLEHGAKANVSDKYGDTPLIEAAGWAETDTLKLLLKHGKSFFSSFVNARSVRGHSALMCAVSNNPDKNVIKVLLEAGAKCDVKMNAGKYPGRNKRKIEDGLISSSNMFLNSAGFGWLQPPLFVAVKKRRKEIVELLLKHGANPNWKYADTGINFRNPLFYCKDIEIAALLIKAGAKDASPTDKVTYKKFREACRSEKITVLEKMLKSLEFRNAQERGRTLNTAFRIAVASNDLQVVKWLLKQGARISQDCIIYAVSNADNPGVLRYLLKHGLTTKYRNRYWDKDRYRGKGALHFASSAEIVDILVKNGMNVNEYDDAGIKRLTPLQYAIDRYWHRDSWRRFEVIEALITHGAKLETTDNEGKTALLTAFNRQYSSPSIKVVKILLKHGANVNAKDKRGYVALKYAVNKNYCYLVDMLLAAGADPDLVKKEDIQKARPYIRRRIEKALTYKKQPDGK